MPHIRGTIERDAGYFRFASSPGNIAVVQAGVVDCAPRPFTYRLSPILKKFPYLGPRVLGWLHRHRSSLQKVSSYQLTSQKRFVRELKRIMELFGQMRVSCVFMGIPLPHDAIEFRSPGFQRAVREYNGLIKNTVGAAFCDIEASVEAAGRENCLLADGHHLSERGHAVYSAALMEAIALIDPSLANGKIVGLRL